MLRQPRTWFAAVAVWFATLFFLSSQSHLQPPGPDFAGVDKVYHTVYFTIGGVSFFLGLRTWRRDMGFGAALALTMLFCSVIGASDEFHQWFVPNRSGLDPWDWLADTGGGLLGSLLGQGTHCCLRMQKAPCESCESS